MQTDIGDHLMNITKKHSKTASPQEQNESMNRKRYVKDTHVEIQDLEAKISKQTAKIIKSKVDQDAAHWELKEQCKELESIRERQQQNLVELQMQYETLDGEYQKELKLREDIVNKVVNTRLISNILEDHFSRLGETLSRCQNDRKTLIDAYQKVVQVIKDGKIKHAEAEEKHITSINNLKEQVETEKNHKIQLSEHWAETKKGMEDFITELKSIRNDRETVINELKKSRDDIKKEFALLQTEIDTNKSDMDQKDKIIQALEHELKEAKNKYNNAITEMKMFVVKQEKELEKCSGENNSLKKALSNQEEFIRKLGTENSQLMDNISLLEKETMRLNTNLSEALSRNEILAQNMQELQMESNNNIAKLMEQCKTQEQMIETGNNGILKANEEIKRLTTEVGDYQQELAVKQKQWENEIVGLKTICEDLELNNANALKQVAAYQKEVADLKKTCADERLDNESKIKEMLESIDVNKKELLAKDDTIAKFMSELKNGTDLRAKLEMALDKSKKDMDLLKNKNMDNIFSTKTLEEKLQISKNELNTTKDKLEISEDENNDLMKQLKALMEKMNKTSKELEHSKQCLAATNALVVSQRESQKPHHIIEERSISHSPATKSSQLLSSRASLIKEAWVKPTSVPKITNKNNAKVTFASPEKQVKQMSQNTPDLDFDFLSDSSVESGFKINPAVVNRRFNSMKRGKSTSPLGVAPTKRKMTVHQPPQSQEYLEYSRKEAKLSLSQNEPTRFKKKTFFRNKLNTPYEPSKKSNNISSGDDN